MSWGCGLSIAQAQFAPAAGMPGSTALHRDSVTWAGWATQCIVQRGPQDCNRPSQGLASAGTPTQATGSSDGLILSLGDGGSATLTFAHPIKNGSGPDFAVFENAFNNTFLELALVEVSSDGQHFVRFPAISNTDTTVQVGSFGAVNPSHLYNLAGKYRATYGTPFDLEELRDSSGIDLNAITHVRLIDVVGSINPIYGKRDSRGWLINDPWNTPFPSSGFDLDAIGVLHHQRDIGVKQVPEISDALYPNPLVGSTPLHCDAALQPTKLSIFDALGRPLAHFSHPVFPLDLSDLPQGVYLISYSVNHQIQTQRLIKH